MTALPLNLPAPQRGHLSRSPLQLVACEVRYADPRHQINASLSADIVKALANVGYPYPKVNPIQVSSLALNLSPAGLQSSQTPPATAYRLATDDARWTVTLAPETVSLETPRYGRWEGDFREHFLAILKTAADRLEPQVLSRIGLRYVDLLVEPDVTEPSGWRGRIRDEFLGPLIDANFGPAVQLSQQQVNLQVSDSLNAVLRHGLFFDRTTEPALRYLIDTDVYRDTFAAFSVDQIGAALEDMHKASSQLFQYVIAPSYYEELKNKK